MSNRNVIKLELNISSDYVVSLEEGITRLKLHPEVQKLGLQYLSSINELVELLDLSRATFERNIVDNNIVNTGVRHLDVTGKNFPRTRIYIDAVDLIEYLIKYCDLNYWKKEKVGSQFYLKKLKEDSISKEDIQYLAESLINGRLKSSSIIEKEYNRTRRIVSRLNNIIESITFSFPKSQRKLRRFVFSPTDDKNTIENYFRYYKRYEDMIIKKD